MSKAAARVWPRRLLYLPSMTSLEHQPGHVYGDIVEPEYNAISYTWGRYEASSGQRLGVNGVSWKIPAIKEEHFTVQQFKEALETARCLSGFIWLDVACIDQENYFIKMDEIGKQAAIFRSAKQVYVWLTSLNTSVMQSALETIGLLSGKVHQIIYQENFSPMDNFEDLLHQERLLDDFETSFTMIFADPWFSSLWTLQEAYLSETATFLSQTSGMAPYSRPFYKPTSKRDLLTLSGDCEETKVALLTYEGMDTRIDRILYLIERSGLSVLGSPAQDYPASLLYSAASYRTTRDPLDRIYGIMQVYNLRLGASAEPNKSFTVTELENQLGAALNAMSPIAAQGHVHTIPQPPDETWRVGQKSLLPNTFYITAFHDSRCKIFFDETQRPRFQGQACDVNRLAEFWTEASLLQDQLFSNYKDYSFMHYSTYLYLDAIVGSSAKDFTLHDLPRASCDCHNCQQSTVVEKDAVEAFLGKFPQPLSDYRILFLGNKTVYRFVGPGKSLTVSARAGILAKKAEFGGKCFWKRVGIVCWEKRVSILPGENDLDNLWHPFDDYIG
ncbi:hypothetical protein MMC18_003588 [Xylographa bjoerkii]|nr:hypothetical protein [Xylographa bjoerkii]